MDNPLKSTRSTVMLARALIGFTIIWNLIEGPVSIGVGAGAGSVALVSFGLDSFIEVLAALVALSHIAGSTTGPSVRREGLARRVIAATFVCLTGYVLAGSSYMFVQGQAPSAPVVGIIVAIASLIVMPAVGLAKLRIARALGSQVLVAESTQTVVCAYLSLTLLLGVGANRLAGWWWADPLAALAMLPLLVREAFRGLQAGIERPGGTEGGIGTYRPA